MRTVSRDGENSQMASRRLLGKGMRLDRIDGVMIANLTEC